MKHNSEFPEHTDENRRIWDDNAYWWDDQIGDGNAFQDVLIEPATERLLQVCPGDSVLDVACGAGRLARRLAKVGAKVVGIDYSAKFIERARQRNDAEGVEVDYRVMDACNEEALLSLGVHEFDRAVCTMALMDMASLEPLMRSLGKLLKPKGFFVFSVAHPCFHSSAVQRFMEMYEERAGRHVVRKGVKVSKYLTPEARKTEGIIGQPEPQYYFHRPLHVLLGVGFRAGFVVNALEEPAFPPEVTESKGVRWMDMSEIPPVMVVRMILGGTSQPFAAAGADEPRR
jgi:2-polyprenyl-3-methyl-5-hydroxy-6-metoxy-1,4-benzoquinol methylase